MSGRRCRREEAVRIGGDVEKGTALTLVKSNDSNDSNDLNDSNIFKQSILILMKGACFSNLHDFHWFSSVWAGPKRCG